MQLLPVGAAIFKGETASDFSSEYHITVDFERRQLLPIFHSSPDFFGWRL
jgi:hypothetical protein